MNIYLTAGIVFLILGGLIVVKGQKGSRARLFVVSFCFLTLFAIASLRGDSVGKDLENYLNFHAILGYTSWSDISTFRFEMGFVALSKAIQIFTDNSNIYVSIIAFFALIGPSYFIYKFSSNPGFSFYLYVVMGFYFFLLSGLRQSISNSIILIALTFLADKKYYKYIFSNASAILFHKSAIVGFAFSFFANGQIQTKKIPIYLFLVAFSIFIAPALLVNLTLFLGVYDQYNADTYAYNYALVMLVIFISSIPFKNKIVNQYPEYNLIYNMVFAAVLLQMMAYVTTNMARVSEIFYVATVVLIPMCIRQFKDLNLRIYAYILVIVFSLVQYFIAFDGVYGTTPYLFFWED